MLRTVTHRSIAIMLACTCTYRYVIHLTKLCMMWRILWFQWFVFNPVMTSAEYTWTGVYLGNACYLAKLQFKPNHLQWVPEPLGPQYSHFIKQVLQFGSRMYKALLVKNGFGWNGAMLLKLNISFTVKHCHTTCTSLHWWRSHHFTWKLIVSGGGTRWLYGPMDIFDPALNPICAWGHNK